MTDLVRKSRKKLGFGNAISTIENTPDYNKMTDQDRPFLNCSACFPHPEKPDTNMRVMIFANPYLLGLLKGLVDIFMGDLFNNTYLIHVHLSGPSQLIYLSKDRHSIPLYIQ